jgi:hypothetical protein
MPDMACQERSWPSVGLVAVQLQHRIGCCYGSNANPEPGNVSDDKNAAPLIRHSASAKVALDPVDEPFVGFSRERNAGVLRFVEKAKKANADGCDRLLS